LSPRLWIVGGGNATLEVWAVAQSLGCPMGGFVTLDGSCEFDPEGLPCRKEADFLLEAVPGTDLVVLAIGDPRIRRRLDGAFAAAGLTFPTLVHPSAVLGPRVTLGEGTVVMAGAVLETHLTVGRHCMINVLASVAHHCVIGDYSNLGPGCHLAGSVQLGEGCDAGTGSSYRPGVKLGPGTLVGAGSAVVADWPGHMAIAGVPAKPLIRTSSPKP